VLIFLSDPDVAMNFILDTATATSLKLKWDQPATGEFKEYKLKLVDGQTEVETKTTPMGTPTLEFTSLSGGKQYTAELYTVGLNDAESEKLEATFNTG
jgi:hypothetical protein